MVQPWIQSYPCKTKFAHETEKRLLKFLEPLQAPMLCVQTTRRNLVEHVRFCHGITALLQHFIDPRQMASLKEPSDEQRKARQQYCYSQDWMNNGGQILWNAIAICGMSKTSWQTGKRRTNDDLDQFNKEELDAVGELSKVCSQVVSKKLVRGASRWTRHSLVSQ